MEEYLSERIDADILSELIENVYKITRESNNLDISLDKTILNDHCLDIEKLIEKLIDTYKTIKRNLYHKLVPQAKEDYSQLYLTQEEYMKLISKINMWPEKGKRHFLKSILNMNELMEKKIKHGKYA